MSLRRTTSAVASVLALAAAGSMPAAAAAHGRSNSFHRLSTFPVYLNSSIDDTAAAEISTVTEDGRTVVYTDSPGKRIGFVDITNPSRPAAPNGAGKTTAVRVLATLIRPDAGHATVGGFDVVRQAHEVRRLIGPASARRSRPYSRIVSSIR